MNYKLGEALVTLQNTKPQDIPPFDQNLHIQIKEEILRLNNEIKKLHLITQSNKQIHPEEQSLNKVKMALLLDQIYRLKRFLLIYYNNRCNRCESQFWMFGGDVKESEKKNLTEKQEEYFKKYKDLALDYIDQVGVQLQIDLDPPLRYEVEVRILEECGQFLDDDGQNVSLTKNSVHSIQRKYVQTYVKQGKAIILKKK